MCGGKPSLSADSVWSVWEIGTRTEIVGTADNSSTTTVAAPPAQKDSTWQWCCLVSNSHEVVLHQVLKRVTNLNQNIFTIKSKQVSQRENYFDNHL